MGAVPDYGDVKEQDDEKRRIEDDKLAESKAALSRVRKAAEEIRGKSGEMPPATARRAARRGGGRGINQLFEWFSVQ